MKAGDRIIYTKGQLSYQRELRGVYVEKRKGETCRILVDDMTYPTDTTDSRVRPDDSAQRTTCD